MFNTTLTFLKQLDKQLHILGCFALTMTIGYWLTPLFGYWFAALLSLLLATALAAFATACLGVAKEVYDKQHPDKHTADPMDLVADAVGILAACLVLLLPMIYLQLHT